MEVAQITLSPPEAFVHRYQVVPTMGPCLWDLQREQRAFGNTETRVETAVRLALPTLPLVINNGGIGEGIMGMNLSVRKPLDVAKLGGNFTIVAQGLGIYCERVEQAGHTTLAIGATFRLPKTAKRC